MPALRNVLIRNKLILLLILPILALLYFASTTILDRYKYEVEYNSVNALIKVGVVVGNFVHESQKERGMTAGFIGTSGKKFAAELPKQHQVLDAKLQLFQAELKQFNLNDYHANFSDILNDIKRELSRRDTIRQQVLARSISAKDAIMYYTNLNKISLDLIAYMIHMSSDGQLIRREAAYVNFLQSKERAGIERAILTAAFSTDRFAPGMGEKFTKLISAQNTYLETFNSLATEEQQQALAELLQSPVVAEVNAMRNTALSKIYDGQFGVDSSVWFKAITKKIDLLKEMETSLSTDLAKLSMQLKEDAIFDLYLYSITLILVLLIGFILVWMISKNILGQISKLQSAIQHVAETGEFGYFSNIKDNDEIGQMAASFDGLLHNLRGAITESNTVITAISNGDFSQRVKVELKGDLHTLKEGINHSAENIDNTMTQLGSVINSLKLGNFGIDISNDARGRYGEVLNDTKEAMAILNGTVTDVNNVMSAMEQGQFDQRIQAQANGDLDIMKQRVNNAMTVLESAVHDISRVMVAQSSGDLTQSITAQYRGELAIASDAINDSASKMNTTINQIVAVAQNVTASVQEVASGSDDLNKRTQQAAATLEETSASMEEITETVKQNTEVSHHANQVATDARDEAVNGGSIANKAVVSMNIITESSQKILDIIGLIDSIAFQTNLLALNAAVEAARAGEHGRGFAVVAGEVRTLAQKSAEASKDIKNLIEETVSNVKSGSEFVVQTGSALETINVSIQNVNSMISEISTSSSEQQKGILHVNGAVSEIDTMTQQNSALVEETTAAAEALMEQAETLSELIRFFKTTNKGISTT
ncbi:MAG: methyl-accepting chemotaxis protein [Thiomicrorhabdus sp.]|nr:MAG: methyl-accepting chemotaxis protein [Thiomicrorhabdus sp.]